MHPTNPMSTPVADWRVDIPSAAGSVTSRARCEVCPDHAGNSLRSPPLHKCCAMTNRARLTMERVTAPNNPSDISEMVTLYTNKQSAKRIIPNTKEQYALCYTLRRWKRFSVEELGRGFNPTRNMTCLQTPWRTAAAAYALIWSVTEWLWRHLPE
jgi:hypothetical protein